MLQYKIYLLVIVSDSICSLPYYILQRIIVSLVRRMLLILTLSYWFIFMQVVGSSASSTENANEIYFVFRKQCFIFSAEKNTFCKLPYPTKESFGYYLKSTGHGSEAKVAIATDKWGRNA